ncbi:MAG TPA: ABC transporter substrate-binding protein, partial [Actinomycetota bacterium]|nr:ABC transporter substrate-binding protein [Actinomycetota bacterium]
MRRAARTLVATAVLGTLVAVAFAGNALAQSSSGSASPSGSQKITFIEGTLGDLGSVNPFKALTTTEYEVLSLNFDMLENFDKANLTAAPGLATKWTNSSDDLTWTFDIRNDAKWQDGQPLTAKDIAFTYNLILKCQLGNSLNYLVPDFTKTITAPSDTQLVWTLKKPTIAPIRPPWVYIIPEHIWGSSSCHDINTAKFFTDGQPMVGSG